MKDFLIGLIKMSAFIAFLLGLLWFFGGVHPKDSPAFLQSKAVGFFNAVKQGVLDFADSSKKLAKSADDRFDEARDVYEGKDPADPYAGI